MSYNIILNSSNVIKTSIGCDIYQYDFKGGGFDIPPDSEIWWVTCMIPYSWYNINICMQIVHCLILFLLQLV